MTSYIGKDWETLVREGLDDLDDRHFLEDFQEDYEPLETLGEGHRRLYQRWRHRLLERDVWRDRQGVTHLISEMDEPYRLNVMAFLERELPFLQESWLTQALPREVASIEEDPLAWLGKSNTLLRRHNGTPHDLSIGQSRYRLVSHQAREKK